MDFDLMTGGLTWKESAALARQVEELGFSGMLFTEAGQVPWMMIQAAAMAAPTLEFTTGIAVAFPRSPMISAQIAWELAQNTEGRFRLGLGSQVRGHVVRRYASLFDKPAPQMRDYVAAVRACLRAFRGEEKLSHDGPYYQLSLLPAQWAPTRHAYEDVKVDISAVGPYMCRVAGELCDGVHVHPMHSLPYVQNRLLPAVEEGAKKAGRSARDLDLIVPVFAIPGDTPEERQPLIERARVQLSFYGSTPNYAFQFDDLGFTGTTPKLGQLMKAGDIAGMAATITDEMLEHFAVVARWDDLADRLLARYDGIAARVVMYLAQDDMRRNPGNAPKWGEVARAVRGDAAIALTPGAHPKEGRPWPVSRRSRTEPSSSTPSTMRPTAPRTTCGPSSARSRPCTGARASRRSSPSGPSPATPTSAGSAATPTCSCRSPGSRRSRATGSGSTPSSTTCAS